MDQFNPTEPEIAQACEAIQRTWTETTRRARIADDHERHEPYTVPEWTPDTRISDVLER